MKIERKITENVILIINQDVEQVNVDAEKNKIYFGFQIQNSWKGIL